MVNINPNSVLTIDLTAGSQTIDTKNKYTALNLGNYTGYSFVTDGKTLTISKGETVVTIKNSAKLKYLRQATGTDFFDMISNGTMRYVDVIYPKGTVSTGTIYSDTINNSQYTLYKDTEKTIIEDDTTKRGITVNANTGDDTIIGSRYSDTINGLGGRDYIYGSTGDDKITAGTGYNTLFYASGKHFGNDTVTLTKDETLIIKFEENVHPTYSQGAGAARNDLVITTDLGTVTLKNYYGTEISANVSIQNGTDAAVNLKSSRVFNFDENDIINGTITGSAVSDDIDVSGMTNPLKTVRGIEYGATINSKGGGDRVTGSKFADVINGGNSGMSYLYGEGGNDTIIGGNGYDNINGGDGDDYIDGKDYTDGISGGKGNDTITGGKGGDVFYFTPGTDGVDIITDAELGDEIWISGFSIDVGALHYGKAGNNLEIYYSDKYDQDNKIIVKNYFSTRADKRINSIRVKYQIYHIADRIAEQGYLPITGNGSINGTKDNDTIYGSNGVDRINGMAGNDTIAADMGDDTLTGGAGNDTFIFNTSRVNGVDTITDAAKGDIIKVVTSTTITAGDITYGKNGNHLEIFYNPNNTDDKIVVQNYFTTKQDKRIKDLVISKTGSADINVNISNIVPVMITGTGTINGTKDDDVIVGSYKDDRINGMAGNDDITGGKGNDTLTGGAGNDVFVFDTSVVNGIDTITDAAKGDVIKVITSTAITANDITYGKNGNHLEIFYNPANTDDKVVVQNYFSTKQEKRIDTLRIVKDGDPDVYVNISNIATNVITGTGTINGTKDADSIVGSYKDDRINGMQGNDVITGGKGNDSITGGAGHNIINHSAGDGDDVVTLTKGEQFELRFSGIDTDDIQYAFVNNDLKLYYDKAGVTGSVTIKNFAASDITNNGTAKADDSSYVKIFADDGVYSVDLRGETLVRAVDKQTFTGGWLSEILDASGSHASDKGFTLNGGKGNDVLIGSHSTDTLTGAEGSDTITGGLGDDKLTGGKGSDAFVFNATDGIDTITDAESADYVLINDVNPNSIAFGKAGNNLEIYYDKNDTDNKIIVQGYYSKKADARLQSVLVKNGEVITPVEISNTPFITGKGTITGTKDAEEILGSNTNDTVNGMAGNDVINGRAGNDILKGGDGNDTITGGKGDDKLYGDAGNNTLIFNTGDGSDTVFSGKGTDTLRFVGDDNTQPLLTFEKASNKKDLIIRYGLERNSSAITVKDYYTGKNDDVNAKCSVKYVQIGTSAPITIADAIVQANTTYKNAVISGDGELVATAKTQYVLGGEGDNDINISASTQPVISVNAGGGENTINAGDKMGKTINILWDESTPVATGDGHYNNAITFGNVNGSTLNLEGGKNSVTVHAGNNFIVNGGDGDDTINSHGGDSHVINAGEGNNTIDVLGRWATVSSGSGNDTVTLLSTSTGTSVETGAGNDTITSGGSNATIDAGEGNDIININAGGTAVLGAGNDTINIGGGNISVTVNPGTGNDIVNLSDTKSGNTYVQLNRGDGRVTVKNMHANYSYGGSYLDIVPDPSCYFAGVKNGKNLDIKLLNTDGSETGDVLTVENYYLQNGNINNDVAANTYVKMGNNYSSSFPVSIRKLANNQNGTNQNDIIFGTSGDDSISVLQGVSQVVVPGGGNDTVDLTSAVGTTWIEFQTGQGNLTLNNTGSVIFLMDAETVDDLNFTNLEKYGNDLIMRRVVGTEVQVLRINDCFYGADQGAWAGSCKNIDFYNKETGTKITSLYNYLHNCEVWVREPDANGILIPANGALLNKLQAGATTTNTVKILNVEGAYTIYSSGNSNAPLIDLSWVANPNNVEWEKTLNQYGSALKDLIIKPNENTTITIDGYFSTSSGYVVDRVKWQGDVIQRMSTDIAQVYSSDYSTATEDQTIYGSWINDSITGSAYNDTVYGNGGYNTYHLDNGGQDTIHPITGADANNVPKDHIIFDNYGFEDMTIARNEDTHNLEIAYGDGDDKVTALTSYMNSGKRMVQIQDKHGEVRNYFFDYQASTINGTDGTDVLYSTTGTGYIRLGKGDDEIHPTGVDDRIYFYAGDGDDTVYNTIRTDKDITKLYFENFDLYNDLTYTFNNRDLIIGYNGNQDSVTINNYLSPDNRVNRLSGLSGGSPVGNAFITSILASKDIIVTYSTTTDRSAQTDPEQIYALDNNTLLRAGSAGDEIHLFGTDGQNVFGNDGDDTVYGSDGADTISGGKGADTIIGGAGNDVLYGKNGNDLIYGGEGDDILNGENNADTIYGGAGNDTIDGGPGDDMIYTGEGANILRYSQFAGHDTVELTGSANTFLIYDAGTITYDYNTTNGNLTIGYGTSGDTIATNLNTAGQVEVIGIDPTSQTQVSDNHIIMGTPDSATVTGTDGDDIFFVRANQTQIQSFGGDDIYYINNQGTGTGSGHVTHTLQNKTSGSGTIYLTDIDLTGDDYNFALANNYEDLKINYNGDKDSVVIKGFAKPHNAINTIEGSDGVEQNILDMVSEQGLTIGGKILTISNNSTVDRFNPGDNQDFIIGLENATTIYAGRESDTVYSYANGASIFTNFDPAVETEDNKKDPTAGVLDEVNAYGSGNNIHAQSETNIIHTYGINSNDCYTAYSDQSTDITDDGGVDAFMLQNTYGTTDGQLKIGGNLNTYLFFKIGAEEYTDFDLELVNAEYIESAEMGVPGYKRVKIDNNAVESISTSDGWTITSEQVNEVAEATAGWLSDHGYQSFDSITNPDDIQAYTDFIQTTAADMWHQLA